MSRKTNYNDVTVMRQLVQTALQLIERDQYALSNMHLIPFSLRAYIQEVRPLLIFLIRLGN